jgi:hypothetical protein
MRTCERINRLVSVCISHLFQVSPSALSSSKGATCANPHSLPDLGCLPGCVNQVMAVRARNIGSVACAIAVAVGGLLLLITSLADVHIHAAPLDDQGTGSDPRIEAITVTSSLPISDTRPSAGVTKTVYFNNGADGIVTATFEISGTPTLTFTAGAAFDEHERDYTSPASTASFVVTYAVAAAHATQPGIAYTAVNTDGVQTTVVINYVRDVVVPELSSPAIIIAANEDAFFVSGIALFYTNTLGSGAFIVRGNAADNLSGLDRAVFSTAFGQTPGDDVNPGVFIGNYDVSTGETESGIITATVYDNVGNAAVQTYTYQLDGTPPVGSVVIDGGAMYATQAQVTLALYADDTGCGVAQMCVDESAVCSSWEPYATAKPVTLTGGDGEKIVYVWYRDHLDNTSVVYSDTIFLDTASPVVTVTAPPMTSTLPFTVSWEAVDPSPGSGLVVSYTVAYREDGGNWETWFSPTTLVRAAFFSATLDHTYAFSATVYDQAGNRGEGVAVTRVGLYRVYLPLVMSDWVWWYQFDVYEPNDKVSQAYPLTSTQTVYEAYIWDATDSDDYYAITPATTETVQITLTNIPAGADYDLYVYYQSGSQYPLVAESNRTGNQSESVNFAPTIGRTYYIRVYPYSGFSSSQPYRLTVIYQ